MSDDWDDSTTLAQPVDVKAIRTNTRLKVLRLEEGPGAPREFVLTLPRIVVGRGTDADIRVPSQGVSRTHVELTLADEHYVVRDLDSRNGVRLNGVEVHSATLHDRDVIQLGDAVFTYIESS